jgi:phosphoenolpyruvate carboxykinase (ATP)
MEIGMYGLDRAGFSPTGTVHRNLGFDALYELGVNDDGSVTAANGALVAFSGEKTGRSPNDKRVVKQPSTEGDVWWGEVNKPMSDAGFARNREIAVDFINQAEHVFLVDGYIGWDPEHQIKVRIVCTRPYHAIFMHNMMIRPTPEQLADFGEPEWWVINAGQAKAESGNDTVTGETSVALDFDRKEFVILGTEYAGEMKKGLFTIMNYLMPKQGIMSMHCSANEAFDGSDTALFFGLSGTGKTTLSADPNRRLIGDDEHGWDHKGVFNYEGGCYAKMINLSAEGEPEIFNAIRRGAIMENVVLNADGSPDFTDTSITQNTRGSYPIEFIDNVELPCVGGHPHNVIFLTCDAFGVLPPVSKLTPAEAQYHFISGYTAKVAGTEEGVTEPKATFSACFGAPFLVWHPFKYAELLAQKCAEHNADIWLVNTGWSGGAYGVGERFSLKYTRAIITAILNGTLRDVPVEREAAFGLWIPESCPGVPTEALHPRETWADKIAYDATAKQLADLFRANFEKYADGCCESVRLASPHA